MFVQQCSSITVTASFVRAYFCIFFNLLRAYLCIKGIIFLHILPPLLCAQCSVFANFHVFCVWLQFESKYPEIKIHDMAAGRTRDKRCVRNWTLFFKRTGVDFMCCAKCSCAARWAKVYYRNRVGACTKSMLRPNRRVVFLSENSSEMCSRHLRQQEHNMKRFVWYVQCIFIFLYFFICKWLIFLNN